MTGFAAHMLDAVRDLLVTSMHHRALHRVAQVAAGALGHVAVVRVGVAALRALETFLSGLEVALESAIVAAVDRRVRAQVADADVVGVIPQPNFLRLSLR